MTYGVAWICGDSAFVMADTLTTQSAPPLTNRTSLNEVLREVRGRHVAESLLKVCEIKPGVACTFAGDVERAFEIVDFLRDYANHFDAPEALLHALGVSLEQSGLNRSVQLLLAWSTEGRTPCVIRWDTVSRTAQSGPLLQIGSLGQQHRADHAMLLRRATAIYSEAPTVMLTVAIAQLQAYCLHDDLIKQNVGGISCGLFVQRGETRWQSDLIALPCADHNLQGYVATLVRDGSLFVDSSYDSAYTVLTNRWNGPRNEWADRWVQRWHMEVSRFIPDGMGDCQHWAFPSTQQRVLTVFIAHSPMREHRGFLHAQRAGEGFEVELTQQFGEIVFRQAAMQFHAGPGVDFRVVEGRPVGHRGSK